MDGPARNAYHRKIVERLQATDFEERDERVVLPDRRELRCRRRCWWQDITRDVKPSPQFFAQAVDAVERGNASTTDTRRDELPARTIDSLDEVGIILLEERHLLDVLCLVPLMAKQVVDRRVVSGTQHHAVGPTAQRADRDGGGIDRAEPMERDGALQKSRKVAACFFRSHSFELRRVI